MYLPLEGKQKQTQYLLQKVYKERDEHKRDLNIISAMHMETITYARQLEKELKAKDNALKNALHYCKKAEAYTTEARIYYVISKVLSLYPPREGRAT